jgi:hypothetical protein
VGVIMVIVGGNRSPAASSTGVTFAPMPGGGAFVVSGGF